MPRGEDNPRENLKGSRWGPALPTSTPGAGSVATALAQEPQCRWGCRERSDGEGAAQPRSGVTLRSHVLRQTESYSSLGRP